MFVVEKMRSVTSSMVLDLSERYFKIAEGKIASRAYNHPFLRSSRIFPEFSRTVFVLALQRGTVPKLAIEIQIYVLCNQGFLDFLSFPLRLSSNDGNGDKNAT